MAQFTRLNITGGDRLPLANLFLRQEHTTDRLALILPGLGYNMDMPLLYYPAELLVQKGCDVLKIRPDYQAPAIAGAPQEERLERFYADAAASLQVGLTQRSYHKLVLVGKSIGTISLALLIKRFPNLGKPLTIWITPLLHEPHVIEAALTCRGASFFMVGSADTSFDPIALKTIQERTGALAWVAENANHSLELPGDPLASLALLGSGMHALYAFRDQTL